MQVHTGGRHWPWLILARLPGGVANNLTRHRGWVAAIILDSEALIFQVNSSSAFPHLISWTLKTYFQFLKKKNFI